MTPSKRRAKISGQLECIFLITRFRMYLFIFRMPDHLECILLIAAMSGHLKCTLLIARTPGQLECILLIARTPGHLEYILYVRPASDPLIVDRNICIYR